MESPKTLQEAVQMFSEFENCRQFMVTLRWLDGKVRCPICDSDKVAYIEKSRVYWCAGKHKRQKFSLKVGTIFEDSPISLQKWLPAVWMLANDKNGISSYELHRALGVTQKTAWFMLHRIRAAFKTGGFGQNYKLGGEGFGPVEVDETFIGGAKKNMHKDKQLRYEQRGGAVGKTVVQGFLDRELRQVRAKVVPNVKRETLQTEVLREVKHGSQVYTDDAVQYDNLHSRFVHDVVNHAERYVDGQVHTNGIENFWSLLKRTLRGTYVAVEPFHLDKYLDEQIFRFNNRKTERQSTERLRSFSAGRLADSGQAPDVCRIDGQGGRGGFLALIAGSVDGSRRMRFRAALRLCCSCGLFFGQDAAYVGLRRSQDRSHCALEICVLG